MALRRLLLALGLIILAAFPLPAGSQSTSALSTIVSLKYCQLTATGTAAGLSSCSGGIPSDAKLAVIFINTADIRYRDDGTNPTASVGMYVFQGQTVLYQGRPLSNFKFIAVSGSPILNITFYRS